MWDTTASTGVTIRYDVAIEDTGFNSLGASEEQMAKKDMTPK